MRCKAVTEIMFTVVGPPPKPNQTDMELPETNIQNSISIR